MPILKDILRKQLELRSQISIGNLVIRLLNEQYIGSKVEPAEQKLVSEDGTTVSQESIKAFCQFINDAVVSQKRLELKKLEDVDLIDMVITRISENPELLPFALAKRAAKK